MSTTIILICGLVAIGALVYSAFNFFLVKKKDEGTERMREIADAIRVGADAFIKYEYMILAIVAGIVFVIISVFLSVPNGIAFAIGILMSGTAGFVGMKIATLANVRVTNEARVTKNIGKTLQVALRGGSVMGICVSGFGLLGICICFLLFRNQGMTEPITNWCGLEFIPFSMVLSSYALGCSTIAMFNRVGGGIYTKAADMGADLVGKTEEHIPEDDPRNPATIADNVGDNVGDVAGLGSDLLESYVGAIVSSIVLAIHLFITYKAKGTPLPESVLERLYLFPIVFCAGGVISCILGVAYTLFKKSSTDPHKDLNTSTYVSAGLTIVIGALVNYFLFKDMEIGNLPFKFGIFSPWISAIMGIISGIAIGMIAEYYTSYDFDPTRKIARACKQGPALTITQGLAVGMKSCMYPLIVLGLSLLVAYASSGIYGVAMAAVGMLSFVGTTVSVDTYGPISDNAGGIAEMAGLESDVREITDKLDSVGNTTAAIGKGFAIGSASFAALSLMVSFLYSFMPVDQDLVFNLVNPFILAGILIGGALPWYFSGMLTEAVSNAAQLMVAEVRRQFKEIAGLREGKAKPDYKKCIEISSKGALAEMKKPALISILVPVVTGFIFGAEFVGGLLLGATVSAIMLALFCGNAGGAWDNAKKFIESNGIEGEGKGSSAHEAAVVGDTVGDPLKDTDGPSLDIQIKIMSVVSLLGAPIFASFNLISWISSLF